jgi:hypothetical protein
LHQGVLHQRDDLYVPAAEYFQHPVQSRLRQEPQRLDDNRGWPVLGRRR